MVGRAIQWRGHSAAEQCIALECASNSEVKLGQVIVALDRRYLWTAKVESFLGDASKARTNLGWAPKVPFAELVREMMAGDLVLACCGPQGRLSASERHAQPPVPRLFADPCQVCAVTPQVGPLAGVL